MYCKECGKQIPDDARFCPACGFDQQKKTPRIKGFFVGVIVCAVAVLAVSALFGGDKEKPSEKQFEDKPTVSASAQVTTPVTEAPATEVSSAPTEESLMPPTNGWHDDSGKRYYYDNGIKVTGLQEIGNNVYYFYDDGTLATDSRVKVNGNTLYIENGGRVDGVELAYVSGDWAEKKYNFGNGGSSSILELDMEIENCTRTGFYLEANGLRGAKVNGTWKIYIRSNGSWIFAKSINYSEPSGTFEIKFDTPTDFDAITAYPTVQGNASYSSGFMLTDVYLEF